MCKINIVKNKKGSGELNLKQMKIKKGFTLAEVLITLCIIGIVAEVTVPTLMAQVQDKQFKEAAKEAYSKASQAIQQMKQDAGGSLGEYYGNTGSFYPAMKKYFKIAQDCNLQDCVPSTTQSNIYSSLTGEQADTTWGGVGQFITTDGMFYNIYNGTWNNAIFVSVDVNGYKKKPNVYGRDTFFFELVNDNLVPVGASSSIPSSLTPNAYCNKGTHDASQGISCMEYVLQGQNY